MNSVTVSTTTMATQQSFDMSPEMTVHIGVNEGINGRVAHDQNNGYDVSCVTKIVLGAEVYHGVDDEVWSPTESVNDTNCNNHFCDALSHSHDTLKRKIGKSYFQLKDALILIIVSSVNLKSFCGS